MTPGKTILIVEDSPNDQMLIAEAFHADDVQDRIQFVKNGTEAIAYLMGEGEFADRDRFGYPAMIITDLKMPGGSDGFAVLEHLKNNPAWAILPTIVLTTSKDADDVRTAYLLGANCYHVKPNSFEELKTLMSKIYTYWTMCEIPAIDHSGRQLITGGEGKLGERFPQPKGKMRRVSH